MKRKENLEYRKKEFLREKHGSRKAKLRKRSPPRKRARSSSLGVLEKRGGFAKEYVLHLLASKLRGRARLEGEGEKAGCRSKKVETLHQGGKKASSIILAGLGKGVISAGGGGGVGGEGCRQASEEKEACRRKGTVYAMSHHEKKPGLVAKNRREEGSPREKKRPGKCKKATRLHPPPKVGGAKEGL